jgi:hypothetical protein
MPCHLGQAQKAHQEAQEEVAHYHHEGRPTGRPASSLTDLGRCTPSCPTALNAS